MPIRVEKDYQQALERHIREMFEVNDTVYGWTSVQLATEAKISTSTVNKLRNRETRLPHFRTIFRVSKALGMEVKLIRLQQRRRKGKKVA